jgi:hypothetical protein
LGVGKANAINFMKAKYIADNQGNKTAVILPIKEYEKMMADLEEFECIKAFDETQKHKQEFKPAEEVFKAIEKRFILG